MLLSPLAGMCDRLHAKATIIIKTTQAPLKRVQHKHVKEKKHASVKIGLLEAAIQQHRNGRCDVRHQGDQAEQDVRRNMGKYRGVDQAECGPQSRLPAGRKRRLDVGAEEDTAQCW
jgi:hypothetical protein